MKIFLVILAVLFALGVVAVGMLTMAYFGYVNQDVTLRVEAANTDSLNMTIKDETMKEIFMVAQVTEDYRETFSKVYPDIMNARYGGDGKDETQPPLMKFVMEANPTFDVRMYDRLVDVILEKQAKFQMAQAKLISIKQQHDLLRTTYPSKLFLDNFFRDCPELTIRLVTSKATKDMFKTGEDNDIQLFNRNKK